MEVPVWVTCLVTYYQEVGGGGRGGVYWQHCSLLQCFSKLPYWEITWTNTKIDPLGHSYIVKPPDGILASLRMRAASWAHNLCIILADFPPNSSSHSHSLSAHGYFPYTEALDLILVISLAGSGPLSDSCKPLWHLVNFAVVPEIHSKRLTHLQGG